VYIEALSDATKATILSNYNEMVPIIYMMHMGWRRCPKAQCFLRPEVPILLQG